MHTYFGEFFGEHRGYAIFINVPLSVAEKRRVRY